VACAAKPLPLLKLSARTVVIDPGFAAVTAWLAWPVAQTAATEADSLLAPADGCLGPESCIVNS
jgi:hypothetical protein